MKKIIFVFFTIIIAGNSFSQNLKVTQNLQQKLQSLNPIEYTSILILLNDQLDIEMLDKELYRINASLDYRAQTVINILKQKAQQTQGPILEYLNSEKTSGKVREVKNFWISNIIYAKATPDVIIKLSNRADVLTIDIDNHVDLIEPVRNAPQSDNRSIESVEPGLKVIQADKLWKIGLTGAGRTVMNIDSGVDGLHPALGPRWWGNNGRAWYHSWFDTSDSISTYPRDCSDHGTHTMGTMCGRDSESGDTVGVALDAFWIAAAVTGCGNEGTSNLIASFQWGMDPDSNSATMDMPDVINCSWVDRHLTTDQCTSIYINTINAVEAAGIAVVFAAGNEGPSPSSIGRPTNINTDSVNIFSVGAIDGNTQGYPIWVSSSRGPSICGGSGTLLIKPEVSAPGVNVRSSTPGPDSLYRFNDGTSMAAPHAAGAIALLKQAFPSLTGKQLKAILFSSCTDLGDAGEDNDYGKGLINLPRALQQMGYLSLNAFNINSPDTGVTITSLPNSSSTFTMTWDTTCTGAQYKWIFGSPNTSVRIFSLPSNTNSITMTLGELDEMLANAGVPLGSSLIGQWDVWSFTINNQDSLKSRNGPRTLTLTRGVSALSNFNLISPASGSTIITSAFNTSSININWSRSGKPATYKWNFGSPDLSNIKLSFTPANMGYDTVLTLVNNSLDGILAGLGVNPGDSLVGEWSVWAYNGIDSTKALQNYSLTLRREQQGDVLVFYDSTNANCRISKDSVVANLNTLALTHQLYNRKGSLATNSISLRGYKKVVLLGEGNSIMSGSIKDSIKTYLSSVSTSQKAKLIIMSEDIGFQFDRSGSLFYDSAFCRSMCGFQYVSDRPGLAGPRGIMGESINIDMADSTRGPSNDVIRKSASVPLSETKNLYKFRLYKDSMIAIGRISEKYNVAVFAVDVESLRPAFDSPAGSPVNRLLKGGMNFVDEIITYNLSVRNMSLASINAPDDALEFDVYIEHTNPPAEFEYAGGQYFLSFNSDIIGINLTDTNEATYRIIGSDLPPGMQPVNPSMSTASNYPASILSLSVNTFPGAGNGYIMTNNGSLGTKIVRMRILKKTGTFNNRYLNLAWLNTPVITWETQIFAYVDSAITDITTPQTHTIDSSGIGLLPVELSSLVSNISRNNVSLNWTTESEINNSGFDVERKLFDSDNWIKAGSVSGKGTTNERNTYSFSEILNTGKYNYRLKQIDFNGNYEYYFLSNDVEVGVPSEYSLSQNYPNPFNPSTKIFYDLPYNGNVSMILYDISGREAATLVNEFKQAGYYSIQFNGSNLSSGMYFYRISVNSIVMTKKMLLLK